MEGRTGSHLVGCRGAAHASNCMKYMCHEGARAEGIMHRRFRSVHYATLGGRIWDHQHTLKVCVKRYFVQINKQSLLPTKTLRVLGAGVGLEVSDFPGTRSSDAYCNGHMQYLSIELSLHDNDTYVRKRSCINPWPHVEV